jgi:hypothetical protein
MGLSRAPIHDVSWAGGRSSLPSLPPDSAAPFFAVVEEEKNVREIGEKKSDEEPEELSLRSLNSRSIAVVLFCVMCSGRAEKGTQPQIKSPPPPWSSAHGQKSHWRLSVVFGRDVL